MVLLIKQLINTNSVFLALFSSFSIIITVNEDKKTFLLPQSTTKASLGMVTADIIILKDKQTCEVC